MFSQKIKRIIIGTIAIAVIAVLTVLFFGISHDTNAAVAAARGGEVIEARVTSAVAGEYTQQTAARKWLYEFEYEGKTVQGVTMRYYFEDDLFNDGDYKYIDVCYDPKSGNNFERAYVLAYIDDVPYGAYLLVILSIIPLAVIGVNAVKLRKLNRVKKYGTIARATYISAERNGDKYFAITFRYEVDGESKIAVTPNAYSAQSAERLMEMEEFEIRYLGDLCLITTKC